MNSKVRHPCSSIAAASARVSWRKTKLSIPFRGQTMLIDAPEITIGYMDNDSIDHVFPRGDGVLIGGIKLAGDWNQELDPAISADILARTAKIEPGIAEATVLRQFTGLRPGRAEVRLETERLSARSTVIHNYGHAAVGYTLSWGCAEEVLVLSAKDGGNMTRQNISSGTIYESICGLFSRRASGQCRACLRHNRNRWRGYYHRHRR